MSLRRPSVASSLLAIAAAAFAGCGSAGSGSSGNGVASKSPTEIVASAKAAADTASSVHVSGSLKSEGSPLTLDLDLVSGKGGRGKITSKGLSFELIVLGTSVYISGSPEFYRHFAGASAAQLLQGKWLKAPASSSEFASLSSLTDLRKLLDAGLASHGTLAKGAVTTIEGQKVQAVKDTTKGGTLYVASTGKAYPIQIAKTGSESGKIGFSRWNVPVRIAAPANAVDIAKLKSGQ